ncbi:hypothetical protein P8452_21196 [Trifolium repens]|nr:hypothetical protein P8452_21196 [Trifolium repens]
MNVLCAFLTSFLPNAILLYSIPSFNLFIQLETSLFAESVCWKEDYIQFAAEIDELKPAPGKDQEDIYILLMRNSWSKDLNGEFPD